MAFWLSCNAGLEARLRRHAVSLSSKRNAEPGIAGKPRRAGPEAIHCRVAALAKAASTACGLRLALNGFILPQKAIGVIQRLPSQSPKPSHPTMQHRRRSNLLLAPAICIYRQRYSLNDVPFAPDIRNPIAWDRFVLTRCKRGPVVARAVASQTTFRAK